MPPAAPRPAPPPPPAPPGAARAARRRDAWAPALRAALGAAVRVVRAVIGAPDYDGHVAHCRARGAAPLTRAAFERERQAARYDRPGGRCC